MRKVFLVKNANSAQSVPKAQGVLTLAFDEVLVLALSEIRIIFTKTLAFVKKNVTFVMKENYHQMDEVCQKRKAKALMPMN